MALIFNETVTVTTAFAYDAANELTAQTTNGVTTSYTYDDWGRTSSKSMQSGAHLATYKYRYGHKLADFTSTFPDETGAMMWVTDGLGKRRISQTNGGTGRHHWRWAGAVPIAEYEDANATWWPTTKVKANYPGLAEKNELTGVYRYYSTDLLGSVRRMRNDAKASLATYEYEPYGGAYYNSGIALNAGFTGHQWDSNMGLYYAPFRWYNPTAGRWTTRDPLGMKDGPNVYAYVGGNPVSSIDWLGLLTRCVTKKMHTTAYTNAGPTRSGKKAGPKTVAVGRVGGPDKKHPGRDPAWPMGSVVIVWNPDGDEPDYTGIVLDTGKGNIKRDRDWDPDEWIDVWLKKKKDAYEWGVKDRNVTVCWSDGHHDDDDSMLQGPGPYPPGRI